MIYVIDSISACKFWRNSNHLLSADQYSFQERQLTDLPANYEYLMDKHTAEDLAGMLGLPLPLYTMAPTTDSRSFAKNVKCSVRPRNLPPGSFIEIHCPGLGYEDRLLMASPEFCFVQMANHLSFERLVYLGFEFCGTYATDENADFRQHFRLPLTCAESISEYISSAHMIDGLYKARQASQYIINGSNSPMESKIIIIMIFPFSRGGYSIKRPELNKSVGLSTTGSSILRQEKLIADALWQSEKVVMEYDSNLSHLTKEQHARDKNRISALSHSGYTVIPLTFNDVDSFYNTDCTFCALRKTLGMRAEEQTLKKYKEQRRDLQNLLFSSYRTW